MENRSAYSTADPATFTVLSDTRADIWEPHKGEKAYEWWYFDALSDDGLDAIVAVFLDNFIFSPRYNSHHTSAPKAEPRRFPAVSFTYYSRGKKVCRAECEFSESQFSANSLHAGAAIGNNSFEFSRSPYGNGYRLEIDLPISRGRRISGRLEWLAVESNLLPGEQLATTGHRWNLVAPRCDVTGTLEVTNARNHRTDGGTFRGSGYHDHTVDDRWLVDTVSEWTWGRVHFPDVTAVFYNYSEIGEAACNSEIMLVETGRLDRVRSDCETLSHVRDRFGMRYPNEVMLTGDGVRLGSRAVKIIDSSFYHLRSLSEFTLESDGTTSSTLGITEYIAPAALKFKWLGWLSDLRTGRNGKSSILQ